MAFSASAGYYQNNHTIDMLTCCLQQKLDGVRKIENAIHLFNLTKICFHPDNRNASSVLRQLAKVYLNKGESKSKDIENSCHAMRVSICDLETTYDNLIYTGFWIIVLLTAVVGNGAVCTIISKSSSLKRGITSNFMISLAISDLLAALFVIPVKIDFTLHNQHFCSSQKVCKMYLTCDMIFFIASITNLLGVAVDRYLALLRPYQYQRVMTHRKAKIVIFLIWIYAVILGSLGNINWQSLAFDGITLTSYSRCLVENKYFTTLVLVIAFYIPLIVMGLIYGRILRVAFSHAKSVAKSRPLAQRPCSSERKSKRKKGNVLSHQRQMEFKATKTILTLYGTFAVCWLPLSIISVSMAWCSNCFEGFASKWPRVILVEVLPILNSAANPFIYGLTNRAFRDEARSILRNINRRIFKRDQRGIYHTAKTDRIPLQELKVDK